MDPTLIVRSFAAPVVALVLAFGAGTALATRVAVETPLGSFEIELLDEEAPASVANFLAYVENGDYDGTFFHRAINGFVIQGGGYTLVDGTPTAIAARPPVANEFGRSNVRGTIAMARLSGQPDSATNQWFINVVDNGANLDAVDGGFTVFGEVVGDGMQVVDSILAQAGLWNFGGTFASLPLLAYSGSGPLRPENMITTTIRVVDEAGFAINAGVAGSWFDPATAGQGWFVDVIQDAEGRFELFVAWFTFDLGEPTAEEDLTFGSSRHRWFVAQGPITGDRAEMVLFRSRGGVFDDPREAPRDPVGTLTMRFLDCERAELSYRFEAGAGGSGTIDALRLSPDVFCAQAVR